MLKTSLNCIQKEQTTSNHSDSEIEDDFSLRLKIFVSRPDVIFKTVLRCFKKFYIQDFNSLTDYKKIKRRVSMRNCDLGTIYRRYISLKFPEGEHLNLEEYIQALVNSKAYNNEYMISDLGKVINDTLYRFNKSKLTMLLK